MDAIIDSWLEEQRQIISTSFSMTDDEVNGLLEALDHVSHRHVQENTTILIRGGGVSRLLQCPVFAYADDKNRQVVRTAVVDELVVNKPPILEMTLVVVCAVCFAVLALTGCIV